MPKRYAFLPLVLTIVFAACGGGGGEDEESQITNVITRSVIFPNPADCTELQTQRFTEQVEFASGKKAIRSCAAEERDTSNDPFSLEMSRIAVDGSSATANIAFGGGIFDGQTVRVSLVKEGEQWKLDRLVAFEAFDQRALAAAFLDTATAGPEPVPRGQAKCISKQLAAAQPKALQTALLSGDQAEVGAFTAGC